MMKCTSILYLQQDTFLSNVLIFHSRTSFHPIGVYFNAHHADWHSNGPEDQKGRELADVINNSDLGILYEEQDTRVTNLCRSLPNITGHSRYTIPNSTQKVESRLNSDHLSFITKIRADITNREISKEIAEHRKQKWYEHLDKCQQGEPKL